MGTTNPRYKGFNQTHFTAGDEQQFVHVLNHPCELNAGGDGVAACHADNVFDTVEADVAPVEWAKYADLHPDAVMHTFRYMFHKFKKGVYVRIQGNSLAAFLPFSKANFANEWHGRVRVDADKYASMAEFMEMITATSNRVNGTAHLFKANRVNGRASGWYANDCLVRCEFPVHEGDTNVANLRDMLSAMCRRRAVPDMEFFLHRRDYPLLKRDGSEPYDQIWGTATPLQSHLYPKYAPIMSMSVTDAFADIPIPTWDDWARTQRINHGTVFPHTSKRVYEALAAPTADAWASKTATAVFRGGSTGAGVTADTNPRLKAAMLSHVQPRVAGPPLLDVGITQWNMRPRITEATPVLQTIDVDALPFARTETLTLRQQSDTYKYILHVQGHVSAFRLAGELGSGSLVLLVDSPWRVWYSHLLVPYVHYVPVERDLSDLYAQVEWCRRNDERCFRIAQAAHAFHRTYLGETGILDCLQKTMVRLKRHVGAYKYSSSRPFMLQMESEFIRLHETRSGSMTGVAAIDATTPVMPDPFLRLVHGPYERTPGYLMGVSHAIRSRLATEPLRAVLPVHAQPGGEAGARGPMTTRVNAGGSKDVGGRVDVCSLWLSKNAKAVVKTASGAMRPNGGKRTPWGPGDDLTNCTQKHLEHIHEAYIGLYAVNECVGRVPNFAYTYAFAYADNDAGESGGSGGSESGGGKSERGYTDAGPRVHVVTEHVPGDTLSEHITSGRMCLDGYLELSMQICLALQAAQEQCAFVHNDLAPWNIVVRHCDPPERVVYTLDEGRVVYSVETEWMPVIVDYGKSHAVVDRVHHGYANPLHPLRRQDCVSYLTTTLDMYLSKPRGTFGGMSKDDAVTILQLATYTLRNGGNAFTRISDLKEHLFNARKFNERANDMHHSHGYHTGAEHDTGKRGPPHGKEYGPLDLLTHLRHWHTERRRSGVARYTGSRFALERVDAGPVDGSAARDHARRHDIEYTQVFDSLYTADSVKVFRRSAERLMDAEYTPPQCLGTHHGPVSAAPATLVERYAALQARRDLLDTLARQVGRYTSTMAKAPERVLSRCAKTARAARLADVDAVIHSARAQLDHQFVDLNALAEAGTDTDTAGAEAGTAEANTDTDTGTVSTEAGTTVRDSSVPVFEYVDLLNPHTLESLSSAYRHALNAGVVSERPIVECACPRLSRHAHYPVPSYVRCAACPTRQVHAAHRTYGVQRDLFRERVHQARVHTFAQYQTVLEDTCP